ncbi:MAG: amidohydrolase [Bacteroidales bacterium]|jgi:amidohydrolase|nr:amidohydrolase [Bacteroidales bacterium]
MDSLLDFLPELISLRKELHYSPENSGCEHFTAQILRQFCLPLNPARIVDKLGKTGLALVFESGQPGKTLMFRAEMDALPIEEDIEISYSSPNKALSHICGHDGHMTILCGLAFLLHLHPIQHGRVILLFQPAEETGKGARMILDDLKFKSLQPDYIFALHNIPGYPRHSILVKEGTITMASEGVMISLKGHAAHAAYPDQGISPLPALMEIMEKLPHLVTNKRIYKNFVQLTITYLKTGRFGFGTVPGNAELAVTLRAEQGPELERLHQEMKRMVAKTAKRFYLEEQLNWFQPFSVTGNNQFTVNAIRKVAIRSQFPLIELTEPFRWSEDFGQFTDSYPGAMFGLGAGENHSDLHTWYYDFPDEILETGIKMFYGIIQDLSNN